MALFVKTTTAPVPKTKSAGQVAYLYGAILLVFALAQLFSFEKFIPLFEGFEFPGGAAAAHVVAALLVTSEVFAIPFLVRMRMSPLMRVVSMLFGWLAALLWVLISLWVSVTTLGMANIGMLGAGVPLVSGWWTVFVSLALCVLAVWASWGMWSINNTSNIRVKK